MFFTATCAFRNGRRRKSEDATIERFWESIDDSFNDWTPVKTAYLVRSIKTQLGEGSFWHPEDQKLWFVDIEGRRLFIYDPMTDDLSEWDTRQRIGTVVPSVAGEAIVALQDGVYRMALPSADQDLVTRHPTTDADIRFNDGKCDPAGRLWVGSMHIEARAHLGALYRLDINGLTSVLSPVTISNGICWSSDRRSMYYIDSPRQQVNVFDYDMDTGAISNERVAIHVDNQLGTPDGMTIDSEGMLWVALWGGAAVGRWDPDTGKLLDKIEVPAPNVTSCAFGGQDLCTLYITTASIDMSEADRERYPEAGSLFAYRTSVAGVPAYLCSVWPGRES